MTTVTIQVTLDQARAIAFALDTYCRLCIGQLEVVTALVNDGTIPIGWREPAKDRLGADYDTCKSIDAHMRECKNLLGYWPDGSNGIGHPHVDITGKRAWEIKKALKKAMAVHRDPNPAFPTVDYDGRVVRYTSDPDAVVDVTP